MRKDLREVLLGILGDDEKKWMSTKLAAPRLEEADQMRMRQRGG